MTVTMSLAAPRRSRGRCGALPPPSAAAHTATAVAALDLARRSRARRRRRSRRAPAGAAPRARPRASPRAPRGARRTRTRSPGRPARRRAPPRASVRGLDRRDARIAVPSRGRVPMRTLTSPRYSRADAGSSSCPDPRRDTPRRDCARVIAIFGPTGVGKTAVALALADAAARRAARTRSRSPPTRCRSTAGLEIADRACPTRRSGRALEHRLRLVPAVDATFSVGQYAELAHAEIDALLAAGAPADRRRRHRPLPARRAGRARRCARRRPRTCASAGRRSSSARRARGAARAPRAARAVGGGRRSTRTTASGSCARSSCSTRASSSRRTGPSQLWTDETRRPTLLVGLVMEREALYARIDARVDAMVAARRARGGARAHAAGASETARKALGFDELLTGDVEGDEAPHAQLRASASSPGCASSPACGSST